MRKENDEHHKNSNTFTLAIELFSKGKKPLKVCIELGMDPKEVENAYCSYLRLKDKSKIAKLLEKSSQTLGQFLDFYKFCKERKIEKSTITDIIQRSS